MFIRAMTGFVACGLLLSGSTAFADPGGWKSERYYSRYNSEYDYADVVNVERWKTLPTPRGRLAQEFQSLPDEDLLVSGFDVVLRPV